MNYTPFPTSSELFFGLIVFVSELDFMTRKFQLKEILSMG